MNATERFEQFVSPEPNTGCSLWFGGIHDKHGYGSFQFEKRRGLAHRWAWELYCGEIPAGISVLHDCDNPYCVNPDHLFLGTRVDNIRDMCAKKRQRGAVGSANGNAKLTSEQVAAIRQSKNSIKAICEEFGIGKSMVSYIRSGEYWK